jgi:uncharacterized protein YbjQ (UPF0145 family)
MDTLIVFAILMAIGYFAGSRAEAKHYASIKEREAQFLRLPATNFKTLPDPEREVAKAELVSGSVVIAVDYFKVFIASLRNLVGGNVSTYETLLDRARREATLRMKEQAQGADLILNVRLESSSVGMNTKGNTTGTIEAIAYGTAITYSK